eukprot:COSAG06_NODE_42051_length_385_cov_0.800699_1_plen_103_part_10
MSCVPWKQARPLTFSVYRHDHKVDIIFSQARMPWYLRTRRTATRQLSHLCQQIAERLHDRRIGDLLEGARGLGAGDVGPRHVAAEEHRVPYLSLYLAPVSAHQ